MLDKGSEPAAWEPLGLNKGSESAAWKPLGFEKGSEASKRGSEPAAWEPLGLENGSEPAAWDPLGLDVTWLVSHWSSKKIGIGVRNQAPGTQLIEPGKDSTMP